MKANFWYSAIIFSVLIVFLRCSSPSDPKNSPPIIFEILAVPDTVAPRDTSSLFCTANDPDNDILTYNWQATAGTIIGSGAIVTWNAPDSSGSYTIRCNANDGKGGVDSSAIHIEVEENIIPTDGLVAYYPFNGNANDESGNGHNGTIHGARLTIDRFGYNDKAYRFDGSNDYITFQSQSFPTGNNPFVVAGWFKTTDTGGGNGWNGNTLFSYGNPNIHVTVYAGEFLIHVRENNYIGPYITAPGHFVADGVFHFFVYEYSNNVIKFYLDGILIIDQQYNLSTTYYPFQIGIRKFNPYFYFNGTIDDIRIYNRILTIEEINSLYHENGWSN